MNEGTRVLMVREDLDGLPDFPLPADCVIRSYRPGDEVVWQRIQAAADHYNPITSDLFEREFGTDARLLGQRQFYLCDSNGHPFGTAAAWFGELDGRSLGRLHWVAIAPAMQGRGLAKSLLARTCRRLRELGHAAAYLTTATVRIPAVNLYRRFGFRPRIRDAQDLAVWRTLEPRLKDPLDLP